MISEMNIVRRSAKVAPVPKTITEKILKWYGHVKGRACTNGPFTDVKKEALRRTETPVESLM